MTRFERYAAYVGLREPFSEEEITVVRRALENPLHKYREDVIADIKNMLGVNK